MSTINNLPENNVGLNTNSPSQKTKNNNENKMGNMPVNRLLLSMAIPMIISMMVQALYNIIDSIWVSNINQDALTAISLAFPMQNLMISIGVGTGVGVNALLSKSLGEKNHKMVNQTMGNGLFLSVLSGVFCMLIALVASRTFFTVQTDIVPIIDYGSEYLFICMFFCIPAFGQIFFERLLVSTGKTLYSMITQMSGAVLNIVLDPILIFGYGPAPELGMKGAAIATVTAQFCAMLLAIFFNLKYNHEIHFSSLHNFHPNWNIIKRIYMVALPSIIMMSITSIMIFGFNKILMGFTDAAATVLGIYFKLQSFVFMPIFGLNNGMVPIIAYNYGARKPERMVRTIRLSIVYAIGIMIVGMSIFNIFPKELLLIFNATEEVLEIGIPALRIISLSFLLAGFCIVVGSVFQALENGLLSMLISVCRQLLVLLPCAYLLAQIGNLNIVWFAFPIAEIISLLLSSIGMLYIYRLKIKPLKK